jgi:cell division septum initiation protein DivIVA
MSVVQPDAASVSGTGSDIPAFNSRLRGLDPVEVRAYIDQLRLRLADEARRADAGEQAAARLHHELEVARQHAPLTFEHLGAEAARVLQQAAASATILEQTAKARAGEIVEEAEVEARDLIAQAEQRAATVEEEATGALHEAGAERDRVLAAAAEEADRMRAAADQEAREVLAAAHDEAERIQGHAAAERTAMESETHRLRESRDRMVEFLGRIHADLGQVLTETINASDPPAGHELDLQAETMDVHAEAPAEVNGEVGEAPEPGQTPA